MRSSGRLVPSESGPGDVELAAEALARRLIDFVGLAVHVGYLLVLVLLPIGMACWFLWSCVAAVGESAWGEALGSGLFVLLLSPFALLPSWVLFEASACALRSSAAEREKGPPTDRIP